MLIHGEHPQETAEYVGSSPVMIYKHYAKWLTGHGQFGAAASAAADSSKNDGLLQRK
jgi:hypothetical protein